MLERTEYRRMSLTIMEVLNVIYQTAPGQGNAFYRELKAAGIDVSTRQEDGLICYEFFQSFEDADKIILLEIWKDTKSRFAHKNTQHFKRLTELYDEFPVQFEVRSYHVDDSRKEEAEQI